MRRVIRLFLSILIVFLVIAAGLLGAAAYLNSPPAGSDEKAAFTITKGENLQAVARRLEETRLIRSAFFLVQYAKLRNTDTLFQAGSYLVPRGRTAREIHDFFITGSQLLHRVTIPEGWTTTRIAAYFEEKGIAKSADFLRAAENAGLLSQYKIPGKSAEGYLFPDTYYFPEDFPADKAVGRLIENFLQKIAEIDPDFRRLSPRELADKVTLASIIEREYRDPAEAPLMASVFYNRLGINMALGSCATVEYIITEIQNKPHPDFLTFADLEIPSPYNTYRHPGLPPGPISNPGRTALEAAFKPAKTDYWYFVLKDPAAGTHFFSKSLNEHNRAKVVYLKKVSSGS